MDFIFLEVVIMICLYIHLLNYGGIYNGMGLTEINIDFTKCKHKVILIKGDNGSGKSTIIESISPLPEENGYFAPGLPAAKDIGYLDELTGIRYDISYRHDVKSDGTRATAKGYIKKTFPDGNVQDLNPTGNITPCKEMIFTEFELDPNFIALTKMNTTDKGLVAKTPSERKKYVTSILSATQVYNEMYKVISKKASLFKDTIKRITTKIDSIGNQEKIAIEYQNVCGKIDVLNKQMESLNKAIARAESTMNMIDSSGDVSTRYSEINTRLDEITTHKVALNRSIPKGEKPLSEIESEIDVRKQLLVDMSATYTTNSVMIESLMKDQEYNSMELQEKIVKLNSCSDGATIEEIKDALIGINRNISEVESELRSININPNTTLTSADYSIVFDVFARIHALLFDTYEEDVIRFILNRLEIGHNKDKFELIPDYGDYIDHLCNMSEGMLRVDDGYRALPTLDEFNFINQTVSKSYLPPESSLAEKEMIYKDYLNLVKTAKIIDNRPHNCESTQCPFIKNALQASKKLESYDFTEKDFENDMQSYRASEAMINLMKRCNSIREPLSRELFNIFNVILANRQAFQDISNVLEAKDMTTGYGFVEMLIGIKNGNIRYEECNIYRAFNGINNLFDTRESYLKQKKIYENQLADLTAKNQLIEVISDDIDKLHSKISEIIAKIEANSNSNKTIETQTAQINSELEKLESIKTIYMSIKELEDEEDALIKEKRQIEAQAVKYDEASKILQEANQHKCSVASQLSNLNSHKSELNYNLRLIDQYRAELDAISNQYKRVELVKYYTTPTSAGIQTVFAAMYMNDIVIQSNRILSNLFGGTLTIMPFEINDTEFRIPIAVQNGIPHDDVKSLSAGETSLISMIISFSLVNKSSSKLNILTADELDSVLDPSYRRQFIDTLYAVMDVVGSNQSILISHNSEMNLGDCDIILLKNNNAYGSNISGNVIWSYYNQGM